MDICIVKKPLRKLLYKAGKKANNYFDYCMEVGCDIWDKLKEMPSLCGEPVCLFLGSALTKDNESSYVQGVEVAFDFAGEIPLGFSLMDLPEGEYVQFNGATYDDAVFMEAIEEAQKYINKFDIKSLGYIWDNSLPIIQLEPIGKRGYIELRGIKRI